MTFGVVFLRKRGEVAGELHLHPNKVTVELYGIDEVFAEQVTWDEIVAHNDQTNTAWSGKYLWIKTTNSSIGVLVDPEVHRWHYVYLESELKDALDRIESSVCY